MPLAQSRTQRRRDMDDFQSVRRSRVDDFLSFRWMIIPFVIRVLFVVLVPAAIVVGITLLVLGAKHHRGSEVGAGLATLVLGPILVRLYCEALIIILPDQRNAHRGARARGLGSGKSICRGQRRGTHMTMWVHPAICCPARDI